MERFRTRFALEKRQMLSFGANTACRDAHAATGTAFAKTA
jgi:hypothetical protein